MHNYSKLGANKAIQKVHNPHYGQIYKKINLSENAIRNYVLMQKLGVGINLLNITKNSLQMRKGLCLAYLLDLGLINKDFATKFEKAVNESYSIMRRNKIAHCDIKPQNIVIFADDQIEGIHITSALESFKQIWQRSNGKLSESALSIQKINQTTLSQFEWQLKLIDNDDLKRYGETRQVCTPGLNGWENQFGSPVHQNTDAMGWIYTINQVKKATLIQQMKLKQKQNEREKILAYAEMQRLKRQNLQQKQILAEMQKQRGQIIKKKEKQKWFQSVQQSVGQGKTSMPIIGQYNAYLQNVDQQNDYDQEDEQENQQNQYYQKQNMQYQDVYNLNYKMSQVKVCDQYSYPNPNFGSYGNDNDDNDDENDDNDDNDDNEDNEDDNEDDNHEDDDSNQNNNDCIDDNNQNDNNDSNDNDDDDENYDDDNENYDNDNYEYDDNQYSDQNGW